MTMPQLAADPYAQGLKLAQSGRHAEAIGHFEQALTLQPEDTRVLFALANTAEAIGLDHVAENFFQQVLAKEPNRLEALVNLANLWRSKGRAREVLGLIKPALERNPESPALWLTLGSALRETGDIANAKIFYTEALRLDPDYSPAIGNLADLVSDTGEHDDAIALYDRVIQREPHNAQARLNRAILHLLNGDLDKGWRDYSYRLKIKSQKIAATHGLPKWNGHALKRTRLLVTAEQGIGDQVMFASCIPDLLVWAKRAGGSIVLECEPRLVSLFARSFPEASVHACEIEARGGIKTVHYDWLKARGGASHAVEMGTLPRYMRKEWTDFPNPHAFLMPDDAEKALWRAWFKAQGQGPFTGLCWRSGKLGGLRNLQYAPLEMWATFARDLPGQLVSLQYDAQAEEIAAFEAFTGRKILVPPALDQKNEIDRTAAMIANVDRVVSAPTAVSWIAAGLGVPTYKLLYNMSWTAFGQSYEPFAPSAHLVMPAERGNWLDVFAKAVGLLA